MLKPAELILLTVLLAPHASAATYYEFSTDVDSFDWTSVTQGGGDSLSEVFDPACEVRSVVINRQGGGTTLVGDYFAGNEATPACPDGRDNYNYGGAINSSGVVAGTAIQNSEAFGGIYHTAWLWTESNGFTTIATGFKQKVVMNDSGMVAGAMATIRAPVPNPPGLRCWWSEYSEAFTAAFTWTTDDGVLNVNNYIVNLPAETCANEVLAINNDGQLLIRAVTIQDEGGPGYLAVLTPAPHPLVLAFYTAKALGFEAHAINEAGQVVGVAGGPAERRVVLYTDGDLADVTAAGGYLPAGWALNDRGDVVGGNYLNIGGQVYDLSAYLPPLATSSAAAAINNSSQVTGTIVLEPEAGAHESRPFIFQNGALQVLDQVGSGVDINNSTQVLSHAFIVTNGATTVLPVNGEETIARKINNVGAVVGFFHGAPDAHSRAFIYRQGTALPIVPPGSPWSDSDAYGVNDLGDVVGWYAGYEGSRAFLFRDGVMKDLNRLLVPGSGWVMHSAIDINNAGQILVEASRDGGQYEHFLLTLAPSGTDTDNDRFADHLDNCPATPNYAQEDSDQDGIGDACDNCIMHENANQIDTNQDGYGNVCDGDLNDSGGIVNVGDLAMFRSAFGSSENPAADLNSSGGLVNSADLAIFRTLFGSSPGPSGLVP